MSDATQEVLAQLRALNAKVDALGTPREAMSRREAARAMGVSLSKLEKLIQRGAVKTATDVHLIPMAEVRRYCAPKVKRVRKPSIGVRASRRQPVDSQSDEAVAALRARLRQKARAG